MKTLTKQERLGIADAFRVAKKQERLGIANAFREAKKHLRDGEGCDGTPFICLALGASKHCYRYEAVSIVLNRLGRQRSVRDWLSFVLKIPKKHLTAKNIQQYRHRWLDALIEEFSN